MGQQVPPPVMVPEHLMTATFAQYPFAKGSWKHLVNVVFVFGLSVLHEVFQLGAEIKVNALSSQVGFVPGSGGDARAGVVVAK